MNTNEWINSTDATITIKGYYKDGTGLFIEIATDYSVTLPVKNTFPDIDGPTVLTSPSPVLYSIPPNTSPNSLTNTPVSLIWSVPAGWDITNNQGDQITVQPSQQAGNVSLTTIPPVDA